jgi:hypothetical protein
VLPKGVQASGIQTLDFSLTLVRHQFARFPDMSFITIYIVVNITLALSAWANDAASGLIFALTIGLVAFGSGAGLRGSFYNGWQQISAATMATIFCMGIATLIGAEFSAALLSVELSGSMWGWLGFLASFVVNPGHSRTWTALRSI